MFRLGACQSHVMIQNTVDATQQNVLRHVVACLHLNSALQCAVYSFGEAAQRLTCLILAVLAMQEFHSCGP